MCLIPLPFPDSPSELAIASAEVEEDPALKDN